LKKEESMQKKMLVMALFTLTVAASPSVGADVKQEFVGSEKCKSCHAEEFESWKGTFHAKMIMPRKGGILKDAVEKWTTDGANPGPTKGNVTGTDFKL
jgi:cytochrome c5